MITVYTDGCSKRNPGPSACAYVIQYGPPETPFLHRDEFCYFLGTQRTNNYAELAGILYALGWLVNHQHTSTPITVYTDSKYAIGVITEGNKAKENVELVERIKVLVAQFQSIVFKHVKGHSGDPGNELADALATLAVRQWQTTHRASDELIANDELWADWLLKEESNGKTL